MTRLRKTYRLIALVMTFLVFLSSAGISMDMHYCGGELKSVSFLGKARTCHELARASAAPMMKNCPHHKKMMEEMSCKEDKNCCSNRTIFLEPDQDQNIKTPDFGAGEQGNQFDFACIEAFLVTDTDAGHDVVHFACYKPPILQRDIPVLNQSFLF